MFREVSTQLNSCLLRRLRTWRDFSIVPAIPWNHEYRWHPPGGDRKNERPLERPSSFERDLHFFDAAFCPLRSFPACCEAGMVLLARRSDTCAALFCGMSWAEV